MTAAAPVFYGLNYEEFLEDWDSYTTVKAIICTSSYTPNAATHQYISDLTNECGDPDYARQTVTSRTVSYSSGYAMYDAADVSFGNPVTITGKYLIIAGDTGAAGTSPLFFYVDMNTGGSASSTAAPFTVTWDSTNGIVRVSKP